jgi:hypothetical protein
MKISVGTSEAKQNAEQITYTPQNGFSYAGRIEGLKESVRPFIDQLRALGYSFQYSCDQSPFATIQFDSAGAPQGGGNETPTLVWEYFANRVEIDILEADISAINSISEEELIAIRQHIASPVEGSSPALVDPNAIDLYALMLKGVRHFRIFSPTLRRSKLVSDTYAVQASQANVGSIITSGTLATQEDVPTRLFALPSAVSSKTGFVYGFYKNFPSIQQSGVGRWQVSQEWDFGLWPTFLYGAAL